MSSGTTPEAVSLPEPPTDGITALEYVVSSRNIDSVSHVPSTGNKNLLASSSWDGSVRIHDTSGASSYADATSINAGDTSSAPCLKVSQTMKSGPLLCLSTNVIGHGAIFTGGLSGAIKQFSPETGSISNVGHHSGNGSDNKVACSCLYSWKSNPNILCSAGWDGRFHVWDIRSSSAASSTATDARSRAVATVVLPAKAFSMDMAITATPSSSSDAHSCNVAVATANRRVCIIDIRAGVESENAILKASILQDRESSLKYQTRTIRFFPDGTGFALGSIEGRVAIEYVNERESEQAGKKKYAFKCHRVGEAIYPVNAIAFHPKFGTFATGGADGTVVFWDAENKKRLTSLSKFASTSVAALAFNHDGSEIAVASSYTFEEGEREHPRDEIFVRKVSEEEIRPKQKSQS